MSDFWDPNTWSLRESAAITLSRDGSIFAVVDAELYDEIRANGPWRLWEYKKKRYGLRTRRKGEREPGHNVFLHRWIARRFLPPPLSRIHIIVDHGDSDGLNCRLANLRWATPSENRRNVWGRWWQQKDFLREIGA